MSTIIDGKVLIFTGKIRITRHEAQDLVESLGGIAGSSVTRNTDYLIVGEDPGSKLGKALSYGIKTLSEDEFWSLIKFSQRTEKVLALGIGEPDVLVPLSPEELDNPSLISVEKWHTIFSHCKVITEEGLLEFLSLPLQPTRYPPVETMSYYSKENLKKWLETHGEKPPLGEKVCPYCSYLVLYSIDYYWYCFNCGLFFDNHTVGRHVCTDWEILLDLPVETGLYRKCVLCNNVVFVGNDELVELEESKRKHNYVHSLEFCAEVHTIYSSREEPTLNLEEKYTHYELDILRAKFKHSFDRPRKTKNKTPS